MADFSITHSGVSHPKKASVRPYGKLHLSDFMDIWPTKGRAIGLDHLFCEDGEVEFRIMGYLPEEIPPDGD